MLGELTREHKAYRGLDLAGRQRFLVVVAGQTDGLSGNALEGIEYKRVHNAHGTAANASIRVNLLEHLVDVRCKGLDALLAAFVASFLGFVRFGHGSCY